MGKKTALCILLLCFAAFLFFPGCKKEKAGSHILPQALKPAAGELRVVSLTPRGKTSSPREAQAVVAIFDRPMVALEALTGAQVLPPLKIDPPFSGKFRWLGTRTLSFTPEERFPYATEVKMTIPAGTRSLDDFELSKEVTWSFQTIEPRLVRHFPQDGQKWLKLDTEVLLIFNQAIDKDKATAFISWTGVDGKEKEKQIRFSLAYPPPEKLKEENIEISANQALLLEARQKLSPGMTWVVEVKKGLPGKEGRLAMAKDTAFSFETFEPFRFLGVETDAGHNPDASLQFRFSNPVFYKDLALRLHFEPPVEIPDYYQEWNDASDLIYLSLPFQPEKKYTAWIDPELADQFGNILGEKGEFSFSTGSYPSSVSMTTGYGILEAYAETKYPLFAVNTPSVFFQAGRVRKEEVIPLLHDPKVFWSNEKLVPRKGLFQQEKTLPLDLPRNKRQIFPLNLQSLVPDRTGFVFLQLDTGRPEDKWERYPKAFLQITELGLSGKFSPENIVIWVTELKTGLPVLEAEVEVRDDSNAVKWRGRTDNEGKTEAPGWRALGLSSKDSWMEPRLWVFAGRGGDLAFLSSDWGTGIDPYRFRIAYDWNPQPVAVQGYIFTDRGIYRAGEEVQIKGIIRKKEKGQWQIPALEAVDCEIRDPFQKVVFKAKTPLDEFGSLALNYASAEDSALGFYQVTIKIPPENKAEEPTDLSGSFRIEAFRPAEFEVHLRTSADGFFFGKNYEAEIRANYLFGGAMAGQAVSWHLRFNRAPFSPPGHQGYVFGNEIEWGNGEEEETSRLASSGQSQLDAAGKLAIKMPLRAEEEKDSVLAALEATITGPSRRSVSNRIQALVHRGEYYIGLRPSTSFLEKGERLAVEVIASNPQGTLLPGKRISLKLVKREWRSVRKAGLAGRFHWVTEKEDLEISSQQVATKNEAVSISFLADKAGFYFLLASGKDGLGNPITTTMSFYVTGKDYVPWERRDDDTMELVADAEKYRPGDRARILVKSPYERAKALVTVEREFILESRVLDILGTASTVEIPILAEHIPNVFVSVLVVQGRTADVKAEENQDVGKPAFKIGCINLSVDPKERRLSVEVDKQRDEYKPRENVTLRFRVKNEKGEGCQASLAVAVADVGVLNLIGYETPDPFVEFYGERPLSVRTSETRIHVVGQREYGEKGEDVGGGVGLSREAAAAEQLAEVELRGDFKSTAFWDPSLTTNENGEAEVSFALPDNLTTFRVMAVAQTKDSRFGRGETSFRVSKKLLLQPALPRFVRVGDEFEGGVVIHNLSSRGGNVSLTLEATGLRLLDQETERTLSLGPGESAEVLFPFAAEGPGLAGFGFRAQMGEESDGLKIKLPVRLPRTSETVALSGQTADSAEEKISIPEDIFPEESRVEIQAASSALLGLEGSLDYLTNYPYICLEQRLSSLLPYLVASEILYDFRLTPLSKKEIRDFVQRGLQDLYSYQLDNGGFGLWPDSPAASTYPSCYAVLALVKARQAGFDVDQERTERASYYLQNFLREEWKPERYPFGVRTWKTTRAFALYVLSLLGKPEPAYAERLFAEKDGLSVLAKTLLLKALYFGRGSAEAQQELLQDLLNMVKVGATEAHFEDDEGQEGRWIYSSSARTTATVLQSMIELGQVHPLYPALVRWLVDSQRSGRWRSTQENFYVFYALNEFYRNYENVAADFKGKITLAGTVLLDQSFTMKDRAIKESRVRLSELKSREKEAALRVEKNGEGILYYAARLTYAPRQKREPRDEGIAVSKRLESPDGRSLAAISGGSLVMVTIEVAVPQESLFVVVEDPLPAGFEAVNPAFLTESEEDQRRLEELDKSTVRRWWQGFNHVEMHDDRVLLFADSLPPGVHTHRYLARALNFGSFLVPGTKAEEMYSPEVFGRSPESTVKVRRGNR